VTASPIWVYKAKMLSYPRKEGIVNSAQLNVVKLNESEILQQFYLCSLTVPVTGQRSVPRTRMPPLKRCPMLMAHESFPSDFFSHHASLSRGGITLFGSFDAASSPGPRSASYCLPQLQFNVIETLLVSLHTC